MIKPKIYTQKSKKVRPFPKGYVSKDKGKITLINM